jgi:hypothetical protein
MESTTLNLRNLSKVTGEAEDAECEPRQLASESVLLATSVHCSGGGGAPWIQFYHSIHEALVTGPPQIPTSVHAQITYMKWHSVCL